MNIINTIFGNINSDLSLFNTEEIEIFENSIYKKDDGKYYMKIKFQRRTGKNDL